MEVGNLVAARLVQQARLNARMHMVTRGRGFHLCDPISQSRAGQTPARMFVSMQLILTCFLVSRQLIMSCFAWHNELRAFAYVCSLVRFRSSLCSFLVGHNELVFVA